jgi:diguanylate cyclase (GGDEF)-like protein
MAEYLLGAAVPPRMDAMERPTGPRYAIRGMLLALGAPIGWLLLQAALGGLAGGSISSEVAAHSLLYLYLFGSTVLAFGAFGAWAGSLAGKLAASNAQLEQLAGTDSLTSLRNTRYFQQRLRSECARADRAGTPLSLILMDLDSFKAVNDRFGHAVGDVALAHVAAQISASCRLGDLACRVGGEEFALLCPGAGLAEARGVAERVCSALNENPFPAPDGPLAITASLGVALYRETPDVLYRAADKALYRAKAEGRNRVALEHEEPQATPRPELQ